MPLTPQQLAELQRLKELMRPQAEEFERRMRAVANAEKVSGQGVSLPTDKKAKGGLAEFLKDSAVKHRVYHGTTKDFNAFKPGRTWFATDPEYANIYAGPLTETHGENGRVMPLHVRTTNPKTFNASSEGRGQWTKAEYSDSKLKAKGHDSVLFVDDKGKVVNGYAMHPTQVKSAIGNRGTYDPTNPDITKSHGGTVPSQDVMRLAIGGQGPKNWLKGSVEKVIEPLKSKGITEADRAWLMQHGQQNPEALRIGLEAIPRTEAINQWIERNLTNYIKKQMATHDDPIRKLAEQGIVHMPPEQMGYATSQAETVRKFHGAPRLGQSPEAQAWEDATDVSMHKVPVKHLLEHKNIGIRYGTKHIEPWMEKADPQTQVYMPLDNMHAHYLGFDHLVDILKQDLAEGRIRPEQLSKVSIEHAVRRAHEYDQERKKAMAQTALKATEGMPVHKDYGDGFKWIELALPKELPESWRQKKGALGEDLYFDPKGENSVNPNMEKLEEALKYEGDTMGHCVGGYTPDVASGKSRIFSLRDAKNEPHVTIEVKPNQHLDFNKWWDEQPKELRDEINARARRGEHKGSVFESPEYLSARAALPTVIKQIKGKQNAKPKKEYIPYVQDFVKSGNWSDVGDLQNSELIPLGGGKYGTHEEGKAVYGLRVKKAVDFLSGHPAFKEQHAAKQKRNKDLLNMDYDEQRKLESVYGQPIYPGSHYSAHELLNAIKNPEENIGGLDEYYPSLNRWLEESEKAMKHHGMAHGGITHAHHLEIEERPL